MKEKKITLTSSNITPKQWSNLLIELNLICESWRPYAKIDIHAHGAKKIIVNGLQLLHTFSLLKITQNKKI